jgi:hypothetical protein
VVKNIFTASRDPRDESFLTVVYSLLSIKYAFVLQLIGVLI